MYRVETKDGVLIGNFKHEVDAKTAARMCKDEGIVCFITEEDYFDCYYDWTQKTEIDIRRS